MELAFGVISVIASLAALIATSLERLAVAVATAGLALAGLGLAAGVGVDVAIIVGAGTVAIAVPIVAAVAVLEVDARPARRLQPWKVLLLAPVALLVWPLREASWTSLPVASDRAESAAVLLALLAVAAAGPTVLLLGRRRESEPAETSGPPRTSAKKGPR